MLAARVALPFRSRAGPVRAFASARADQIKSTVADNKVLQFAGYYPLSGVAGSPTFSGPFYGPQSSPQNQEAHTCPPRSSSVGGSRR
jgi:hypothetical protein